MRERTKTALQKKKLHHAMILHSLEVFDTDCTSTLYQAAGLVLKELRAEKGISQKHICDTAGIKQATLSQIENGRYNTGLHRYVEILDVIGVDFNRFVALTKEKLNDARI